MVQYKVNLKEVPSSSIEVLGSDMAIANKEDSQVYITSKQYMNKLFSAIGYRNINVVKILEEYAGKSISSVGDIDPYSVYVDDRTDSFVITAPQSVEWVNAMIHFLTESEFEVNQVKRLDTFYYWDQIVVTNRFGSKFVIYVNMCNEYVTLYSLSYDDNNVLSGIAYEGKFKFEKGQESFDSFKLSISGNINISSYFSIDQKLSIYEYVHLLKQLGYIGIRKGKAFIKDESNEILSITGVLDNMIDYYNDLSWIQQRTTPAPDNKTFYEGCVLITKEVLSGSCMIDEFLSYYKANSSETSDMFLI